MVQERSFSTATEVAALALFLLIGVLVGAAIGGGISWKNVLDIATAVGTCGATLVALWLGLRARFEARQDAWLRAVLTAARTHPSLCNATEKLREAALMSGFRAEGMQDGVYLQIAQGQSVAALQAMLNQPALNIPVDSLILLAPLPRGTSTRLARAMGLLSEVRRSSDILHEPIWSKATLDERERLIRTIAEATLDVVEILDACLRQMQVAADRGVPAVTMQEVFEG